VFTSVRGGERGGGERGAGTIGRCSFESKRRSFVKAGRSRSEARHGGKGAESGRGGLSLGGLGLLAVRSCSSRHAEMHSGTDIYIPQVLNMSLFAGWCMFYRTRGRSDSVQLVEIY
jgi:hypothetical protein